MGEALRRPSLSPPANSHLDFLRRCLQYVEEQRKLQASGVRAILEACRYGGRLGMSRTQVAPGAGEGKARATVRRR